MATNTVHFVESNGRCRTSSGGAVPQEMLFLLLIERRKCISSENHTSSFGTHIGENIEIGPFDQQTGSFVE